MDPAVDQYVERQALEMQPLLQAARRLLLSLDDRLHERFTYGVPFYSYHGYLAYLTTVPRQAYIHLGLVHGAALADEAGLLTGTDRKQVRHLRLESVADLERPAVRALLHQALLLNEQKPARKQRRRD